MRDDQLTDLLRTLEDGREPDPAFADGLYRRLTTGERRGARRWPLVLLAAAAILALAGGAAIGSGLLDLPMTAEATATPSPSQTPITTATPSPAASRGSPSATASPTADPRTPRPTPTPDQATALGVPPGLLPAGSVIITTGEGVRIRDEPSTTGAIVATLPAGDPVYIDPTIHAGPVERDGYEWYSVEYADGSEIWPWQDIASAPITRGWIAAGNATERFVELAEVTCPTELVTLDDLAFELTEWERLVCLRDSPITIEGTFGCDACGGVTPGAGPTWLADVTQHAPIAGAYEYYPFIRVAVPPELDAPANRDIVSATLRVDDPAASSCTYAPDPASSPAPLSVPAEAVELFCRERLVLESFEVIGTDDFGR